MTPDPFSLLNDLSFNKTDVIFEDAVFTPKGLRRKEP